MEDPVIDLRGISKVYGSGHTATRALNDVSLHVPRGELLLIMGPSGSGKTTLLQIMGALLRPSGGTVIVAGADLASLSAGQMARLRLATVGFVFQTGNLLSALSAVENVELALRLAGRRGRRARERAADLLSRLDVGARANHRPEHLSVGEQQRVAIARALANDPPVILADEPTASLDSRSGYRVVEILRDIARADRRTVVVVTHDQRLKELADRIVWLEDGVLTLSARAHDLFIDPVCLMVIDPAATTFSLQHGGAEYRFCSPHCRDEFLRRPPRYELGKRNRQG